MMDEQRMFERDTERVIRAGEIAYDDVRAEFYNHAYRFLLHDDQQRLLRDWQREGRIVVDGRKVRMA